MIDQAITSAAETRSEASTTSPWWPVVAFSLIGLLVTLNVMMHFPQWGAMLTQSDPILTSAL
jgi:hypothetical protein